jgi:hypothetical protein
MVAVGQDTVERLVTPLGTVPADHVDPPLFETRIDA